MITQLTLKEIEAIHLWMTMNKKDYVVLKQSGSSGIGTSTEIVDEKLNTILNVTDYDVW